MSLPQWAPDWARETKIAEDSYARKQARYGSVVASLLILLASALLVLNYFGMLTTNVVQGLTLPIMLVLLTLVILQDSIVPPPSIPTHQRLAAAIYGIAGGLGAGTNKEKSKMKVQLDSMNSLIADQEPEFKKKDLVFGVALSVIEKLDEMRRMLSAGLDSQFPKESLPFVERDLRNLADVIFRLKTINAEEVETQADSLLANMKGFPHPMPVPLFQRGLEWLYRRSNRQALVMEVMVSLFVAALADVVFNIGIPGGIVVFLGMVGFLDVVERRLRQKS